jgi:hypothetical protein
MFEHNTPNNTAPLCRCQSTAGFFMTHRQASFATASVLFLFFCGFISGYFTGKRHTVEEFSAQFHQESFADQVYSSLCTLYEPEKEVTTQLENQPTPAVSIPQPTCAEKNAGATESATIALPINTPLREYYAELIGFGTQKAAEKFAQSLQKKAINTNVKKRLSKTAKGRKVYWYQVVTDRFVSRETLERLVDRIAREEKLKDTRIVTC